MSPVDLHFHSLHSDDGEFAPETLLELAAEAGVRVAALADHNSTDGVAAAIAAGERLGVRVIPAVELDCFFDGGPLHVLGYFIDHADPRWTRVRDAVIELRRAVSDERMALVERLGLVLDREKLAAMAWFGTVTSEHIAEVVLNDPANRDNALLAPYRPGGGRADNPLVNFYWDHCAQGKPAYVRVEYMPVTEAARLIRDTGGVAVLAHPGARFKDDASPLPALAAKGIAGVEAYSTYHSPGECLFWRDQARANNLFVTCGSDFHGKTKPAVRMGGHGAGEAEALAAVRDLHAAAGRQSPL